MDNSVFVLCKQDNVDNVIIERLHICTWDINNNKHFTEYGFEITRGQLQKLNIAIALPKVQSLNDFRCLCPNVSDTNNCRFIFNSDIEEIKPITGNPSFGNNISLSNDRKIAILPINSDFITLDNNILLIDLDIPEQANPTIYFRFLIKSDSPAFAFSKNEVSKKIINYDIRVNECRTASPEIAQLQQRGYHAMQIKKCFCFHIIPNTYNVEFVNGNKLKTIRSLEQVGFNKYLGDIRNSENISLKEHQYNIVFCKQENLSNYSFFSVYSKDHIGDAQVILALFANILCSLLFAAGGLHSKISNTELSYWQRVPIEYWIALTILIILTIYLLFRFIVKK